MRALRFLGGLICAAFAIMMVYCLQQTLSGSANINFRFIDSIYDKVFWVLAIGGCAGIYATTSVSLFKDIAWDDKRALAPLVISGIVFISGLYYHMMFGSPW